MVYFALLVDKYANDLEEVAEDFGFIMFHGTLVVGKHLQELKQENSDLKNYHKPLSFDGLLFEYACPSNLLLNKTSISKSKALDLVETNCLYMLPDPKHKIIFINKGLSSIRKIKSKAHSGNFESKSNQSNSPKNRSNSPKLMKAGNKDPNNTSDAEKPKKVIIASSPPVIEENIVFKDEPKINSKEDFGQVSKEVGYFDDLVSQRREESPAKPRIINRCHPSDQPLSSQFPSFPAFQIREARQKQRPYSNLSSLHQDSDSSGQGDSINLSDYYNPRVPSMYKKFEPRVFKTIKKINAKKIDGQEAKKAPQYDSSLNRKYSAKPSSGLAVANKSLNLSTIKVAPELNNSFAFQIKKSRRKSTKSSWINTSNNISGGQEGEPSKDSNVKILYSGFLFGKPKEFVEAYQQSLQDKKTMEAKKVVKKKVVQTTPSSKLFERLAQPKNRFLAIMSELRDSQRGNKDEKALNSNRTIDSTANKSDSIIRSSSKPKIIDSTFKNRINKALMRLNEDNTFLKDKIHSTAVPANRPSPFRPLVFAELPQNPKPAFPSPRILERPENPQ